MIFNQNQQVSNGFLESSEMTREKLLSEFKKQFMFSLLKSKEFEEWFEENMELEMFDTTISLDNFFNYLRHKKYNLDFYFHGDLNEYQRRNQLARLDMDKFRRLKDQGLSEYCFKIDLPFIKETKKEKNEDQNVGDQPQNQG